MICDRSLSQISLSLGSLLGQNMALVRLAALNLSGLRQGKTLCRAAMGLDLWHFGILLLFITTSVSYSSVQAP